MAAAANYAWDPAAFLEAKEYDTLGEVPEEAYRGPAVISSGDGFASGP